MMRGCPRRRRRRQGAEHRHRTGSLLEPSSSSGGRYHGRYIRYRLDRCPQLTSCISSSRRAPFYSSIQHAAALRCRTHPCLRKVTAVENSRGAQLRCHSHRETESQCLAARSHTHDVGRRLGAPPDHKPVSPCAFERLVLASTRAMSRISSSSCPGPTGPSSHEWAASSGKVGAATSAASMGCQRAQSSGELVAAASPRAESASCRTSAFLIASVLNVGNPCDTREQQSAVKLVS